MSEQERITEHFWHDLALGEAMVSAANESE